MPNQTKPMARVVSLYRRKHHLFCCWSFNAPVPQVATPFTPPQQAARSRRHPAAKSSARKQLLADDAAADPAHADELKVMKAPSTPSRSARSGAAEDADTPAKVKSGEKAAAAPGKATKQLFGKASNNCSAEVVQMYKVVNKCTGSLGGNGSGGAIYGGALPRSLPLICSFIIHLCFLPFSSFSSLSPRWLCRVDQVVDAKGDRAAGQPGGLRP